jgi:ribosomal protein L11 methyltransferase
MIRLAVRCRPEQADTVLADLTVLAPNGVEEDQGPGYVEFAIYGAEGELPEPGELRALAGEGLVDVASTEIPDDWADRWQDFHRPIEIADRMRIRPSWEPSSKRSEVVEIVVDPGRAFGTGAHATTRMCLELLLELSDEGRAAGAFTDLGTGSGVLAIAAAKLGWGPVAGFDHEPASLEAAAVNARANGVEILLRRANLRERVPALAPTVVANLTARLLGEIAANLLTSRLPQRLVVSGILLEEVDRTVNAFTAAGLTERERHSDGDWAALSFAAA